MRQNQGSMQPSKGQLSLFVPDDCPLIKELWVKSGDFDDEKRLAAETIRNCFLRVAKDSAEAANSGVAIKEWWKKGAIAEHTRRTGFQKEATRKPEPNESDIRTAEKTNWVPEGIISAKGVSTVIESMQQEADKKLTKKILAQVWSLDTRLSSSPITIDKTVVDTNCWGKSSLIKQF